MIQILRVSYIDDFCKYKITIFFANNMFCGEI